MDGKAFWEIDDGSMEQKNLLFQAAERYQVLKYDALGTLDLCSIECILEHSIDRRSSTQLLSSSVFFLSLLFNVKVCYFCKIKSFQGLCNIAFIIYLYLPQTVL